MERIGKFYTELITGEDGLISVSVWHDDEGLIFIRETGCCALLAPWTELGVLTRFLEGVIGHVEPVASEPKESCTTCRYRVAGECHRDTPYLMEGYDQGRWPVVLPTDWCGEYHREEV